MRLIQCSETEVLSFTVRLLLSSLKVIISNASLYGQRTYLSNRALTNSLGDMMAILQPGFTSKRKGISQIVRQQQDIRVLVLFFIAPKKS